jgi:hypothetical protein
MPVRLGPRAAQAAEGANIGDRTAVAFGNLDPFEDAFSFSLWQTRHSEFGAGRFPKKRKSFAFSAFQFFKYHLNVF